MYDVIGELAVTVYINYTVIYITIRNLRVAPRAPQRTTNKLEKWAMERGLKFFPSKTTTMIFRKRRKREEEPLEITLGNHIIQQNESTQFKGMTLDSRLNWEEHRENKSQIKKSTEPNKNSGRKEVGNR